jgi:methionine-rich copper-binding protein CopC
METTMKMLGFHLMTAGLALAMFAAGAQAHAFLDHASPLVGSTVSTPPQEVRLWFTQALEPKFSAAQVRSSAGGVVGTGHVDPGAPKELVIPVHALPPGKYKVDWKVLSVDTHRTEGSFGFDVKP